MPSIQDLINQIIPRKLESPLSSPKYLLNGRTQGGLLSPVPPGLLGVNPPEQQQTSIQQPVQEIPQEVVSPQPRSDVGEALAKRAIEQAFPKNMYEDAFRVLRHTTPQGEVKGENTSFGVGKEVDISNEGYDHKSQMEFFRPSKEKIADGDMEGKDGKWHSIDRGLFRINSRTFKDFKDRKAKLLKEAGINSYEDMFDPVLNAKMAKIIYDEQGWNGWHAAPDDLVN